MSTGDYGLPDELMAEKDEGVVILTLNRPEKLNATNAALHGALAMVWRRIAADTSARAVVLTGAGPAFCAGGDLEFLKVIQDDPVTRRAMMHEGEDIIREMVRFPLPVVAAVNGPAVGFGANLALMCDIVLIADTAYFADPHVAVGVVAADGGAAVWPLLIGLLRAKAYILTGDRVSAADAERLGLATRMVHASDVMTEALAVAHRLSAMPPQALQDTKRLLNLHLERAAVPGLAFGFAAEGDTFTTAEHKERVDRLIAGTKDRESGAR